MYRLRSLHWSILLLSVGSVAACGVGEPDAEEPAHTTAETAQAVQSIAAWFRDSSTLRGSATDWDFGHGKAGCGTNEALTGLSVDAGDHQGRAALCRADASRFSGDVTATLFTGSDQRRAQRNGEWANGSWKLECGSGEYLSAVSENSTAYAGDNQFHGVQCARGTNLGTESCVVHEFATGDSRGYLASGDWDNGAFKGECGPSEYAVGVSVSPETGAPNSLLCCGINPVRPIAPVGLYNDLNYTGTSQTLAPGIYSLSAITIGNDKLTSISVPPGMVAKLYENDLYTGSSLVVTSSNADLRNVGFNDKTSSVAVYGAILESGGAPYSIGPVVDLENLKYKVANDPTVIKNLARWANMLGFAWCGGTQTPYVGNNFDVSRNSDGSYAINAHYNSSDPYASGYWADQRLKMTISNFRLSIDPATFAYGSPTMTSLDPIAIDSGTAINPNDTEASIAVALNSNHTDSYAHETNVSFTEGVKLTIKSKAEVPFFGSSEVDTEFSFSATEGWKNTSTTTDVVGTTWTYTSKVPAHSKKLIQLMGLRTKSNVSYTAVATITFDVSFYGFLANGGNARSDHPTNRPFMTATFNSGDLSGIEAMLDLYDHSYVENLGNWDWHWIKANANSYLGSLVGFFRRGITVPLDGHFTGVVGTNATVSEGPVQPL